MTGGHNDFTRLSCVEKETAALRNQCAVSFFAGQFFTKRSAACVRIMTKIFRKVQFAGFFLENGGIIKVDG